MSIYIVGEIGINHNGDIEIAKSLIDEAKVAGADAVKFQKRNIDLVYSKSTLDALRDSPWGTTQREQKQGLEFNQDNYEEIDNYCKEKEIEWFASAWDLDSQEFLRGFDCKKNKIASAMLIYDDLLHMVADEKKHTFISTGMASMDDISNAVKIFEDKNCPFELMHTVSTYPMDEKNANLKVIETLRKKFNCDVGYSGHESGLAVSYAAAAMGITSLERHITLDRAMYGSDQAASLEPEGLFRMVRDLRTLEKIVGDGKKRIWDSELPAKKKLREILG